MRKMWMVAAMAAMLAPGIAQARVPTGVWQNPRATVKVQFRQCGPAMCGRVVWASSDAQAQAGPLVGRDLFDGFTPDGPNRWQGSVLIPDIGASVSGTITQTDANTLVGEGCLLAGVGCRQQTWTRVR